MQIEPSPEQRTWCERGRAAADELVGPRAAAHDGERRLPGELLAALGDRGLLAASVPVEQGGGGCDDLSVLLLIEALAAVCASTAAAVGVTTLVSESLAADGGHGALLVELARGEKRTGIAGVGGQTACLRGGRLVGSCAALGVVGADVCVIVAAAEGEEQEQVAYLLPVDGDGLGQDASGFGLRAFAPSKLTLDRDPGPPLSLEPRERAALSVRTALIGAGIALGVGQAALRCAVEHVKGDRALGEHQLIRFKLADMATRLDAARLLAWRAASQPEAHQALREAAMAKLVSGEAAAYVSQQAVQVCGGAGYLMDGPLERHLRDAKVCELVFGSSERRRLQVAASLTRE